VVHETLEGWYKDPYAIHDARWLSNGRATKLVRDAGQTSYDPPPDGPWVVTPEALANAEPDVGEEPSGDDDASNARWAVYDQVSTQVPSAFDEVGRPWPPN
jgi:hypothetical protein